MFGRKPSAPGGQINLYGALDAHTIAREIYASAAQSTTVDPPTPELARIDGIELCGVGLGWPTAIGPLDLTESDLRSAIQAAAEDPTVCTPRLGVGHDGAWADAEPAFGRYENLRLSENGQTLIGDLVGIPAWFKEILPTAYPNRSIYAAKNYTTPAGKKWPFVIRRVDVLGVCLPAISNLKDLAHAFAAPPEGTRVNGVLVSASMDVDLVRRAFYAEHGSDPQQWFCRSMRIDPDEIIAEDYNGDLYSFPFQVNGSDQTVTFGEPKAVQEQYVAASEHSPRQVAHWWTRAASRAGTEEGARMDPKTLRRALGLAEDATDEQVDAKAKELAEASAAAAAAKDEPAKTEPEPAKDTPAADLPVAASAEQLVAAAQAAGLVVVAKDTWETVKAGAEIGMQLGKEKAEAARDTFLGSAVTDGRISPAQKAHFEKLYDADPEGTRKLVASLQAGLVPVEAAGFANAAEAEETDPFGGMESFYSAEEKERILRFHGKPTNSGSNGTAVRFTTGG